MLEAYIDESGLDGTWPVVCVGAYVAEHDRWESFGKSWSRQLAEAGLDCFHATDSSSHPLWASMLDHIRKHDLTGLLTTVGATEYRTLMTNRSRSLTGNAYAGCAFACALRIGRMAKRAGLGPVAFVIEDGQPNVEWVRRTLESLVGDEKSNIAAVAVAKKTAFVPLQAADFLAHCAGTHQREWLRELVGKGPGRVLHGHMTAELLRTVSAKLEEIARRNRHRKRQAKLAAKRPTKGPAFPA